MKSFDLIHSRREGLISKEPSDYQANQSVIQEEEAIHINMRHIPKQKSQRDHQHRAYLNPNLKSKDEKMNKRMSLGLKLLSGVLNFVCEQQDAFGLLFKSLLNQDGPEDQ